MALSHTMSREEKSRVGNPAGAMIEFDFIVNDMHCAGCMRKIERALGIAKGVTKARCNLSTKRVHVEGDNHSLTNSYLLSLLSEIGFEATTFDAKLLATSDDVQAKKLLRAMAVAGFAAANIMLLSVSVWSGLASDMDAETLSFFHWISALIAIPAVAYAGQPFFGSALKSLRAKSLNMDVPVSLAVLLATAMSLFETVTDGEEVYFDASVSLLFFLLIGRFLDVRMRNRACSAAQNLLSLRANHADLIRQDGSLISTRVADLSPRDLVSVASGGSIPADGFVKEGAGNIDMSLVTGESLPHHLSEGSEVFAGTVNLGQRLVVEVTKEEDESLLSEIVRLMEAAEQGRAGYVRLADRIARFYAPAVHILALATFLGWLLFGASIHTSLMAAIAVLIVTCPCALGLAVPVVQVVASGQLLRNGVLVKSADGLERLADVDEIVFDKTGTITSGDLTLCESHTLTSEEQSLAASMAAQSLHPLSKAITRSFVPRKGMTISEIEEVPGLGLRGTWRGKEVRLGSAAWIGEEREAEVTQNPGLWLHRENRAPKYVAFQDELKVGAAKVIAELGKTFRTHLLSGDTKGAVSKLLEQISFDEARSDNRPGDKIAYLDHLASIGKKTLMVGDGLNDAPALRAAHVSMSPAEAADISQTAADFVFQGKTLRPIVAAIKTAKLSRKLILQNFGLALVYNAIAIPLAIAGLVNPLIAAIAMSSSSLIVTANAMRLTMAKD